MPGEISRKYSGPRGSNPIVPSWMDDAKPAQCVCGHSRSMHMSRELNEDLTIDGPCQKLDWGLSSNCDCKAYRPAKEGGDNGN